MSQPTTFAIEGRLHKVFEMEAKGPTFSTRDFVIEIGGQYPQVIKFQLVQDRCGLIDAFKEGDQIKAYFDLRGREWNGKYLTNLHAWKLEAVGQEPKEDKMYGKADAAPAPANDTAEAIFGDDAENKDDLPF